MPATSIIRGDHDPYIRAWATGAREWGHPLFLRFNWEMNGWWRFPWSEQLNGNQPGEYVRAWRHVHDLFTAAGATNVTWVWCVNIINQETTPLASLYPGDNYVDWVAMDGYNWGFEYRNTWQTFTEIFAPTYAALRQLAPDKPIMIAEVASVEQGGDKAAWIRDALGPQLAARFPAVKAISWFNWNDDDPALTWPIESSAASAAAFGEIVGNSARFLPNRFGNLTTAPIRPPRPERSGR
jgi:beta-mannanase